jgi:penicillin-binding protein 2
VAAAGAALSLALLFVNPPAGVAGVKSPATPESQTASAEAKAFGEISDKNDGTVDSNKPDESVPAAPVPAVAANPLRGRILDRNRVVLANNDASGHRKYPWGALAAHALGYVTDAGKAGVEANFEKVLAAGKDVSLTLDVRIQMITQRCLEEAGVGRGAVVVLDPQDAGILAMASFPDFDPGVFSGDGDSKEIRRLNEDKTGPMINRAVLPDSPGSTYKIVTAVALCRAGKGNLNFACPGFIDYGRPLACWIYAQQHGSHGGPLPMTAALKCSCNCWFFQAGNVVGIDKLAETARLMGLDSATGDIFESRPVTIVDKKWWSENKPGPWTAAETAHASIGMGLVQESPLHMASVAATVASRGDVWKPRLSKDTPAVCTQKQILQDKQMNLIREGMRLVVNDAHGTGKNAMSSRFTVAGKTGTSQKERSENGRTVDDNRAWFIGFAPYEKPKYAISVLVENGQAGGKVCAPIAKKIFEQAMALKEGQPPPAPQRREPVKGHFRVPGMAPN